MRFIFLVVRVHFAYWFVIVIQDRTPRPLWGSYAKEFLAGIFTYTAFFVLVEFIIYLAVLVVVAGAQALWEERFPSWFSGVFKEIWKTENASGLILLLVITPLALETFMFTLFNRFLSTREE